MSRTDGVRGAGTRETDRPEQSDEGTEVVRGWVRGVVRASGGGTPSRMALYSNDAALGIEDVQAMAGLSAGDARAAVASALGGASRATIDDTLSLLSDSVGNVARREVGEVAEQALRSRRGELRTAAHDDRKLARVLGRIGDDPDPASRDLQLAALGVEDSRAAGSLLRRPDVRTALASGSLPPETASIVVAIRDPENGERTEEMFESALGAAGRDPFVFAGARDRVLGSLGSDSFVARSTARAVTWDARDRFAGAALRTFSDFASSLMRGGPVGNVLFGAAAGSIARSEAGAQLAGLLSGVSTLDDAREATAAATSAWIAAAAGLAVGPTLETLLPDTWVGHLAGAVGETASALATDHAAQKVILRL